MHHRNKIILFEYYRQRKYAETKHLTIDNLLPPACTFLKCRLFIFSTLNVLNAQWQWTVCQTLVSQKVKCSDKKMKENVIWLENSHIRRKLNLCYVSKSTFFWIKLNIFTFFLHMKYNPIDWLLLIHRTDQITRWREMAYTQFSI